MTILSSATILEIANSPAASIVIKATAIAALGLTAAWLALKRGAAARHALLAATFGVLLALPVASLLAPPLRIPVTWGQPFGAAAALRGGALDLPPYAGTKPGGSPEGLAPQGLVTAPLPVPLRAKLTTLAMSVWVAGFVAFLLPVLAGAWKIRALRRSAMPWTQRPLALGELARTAGIARPVELLLHESLPGPMTCGVLRPKLLLPRDAEAWHAEDLNRALVHELEHVRRGDWLIQSVARAVCALYWFHPLVWIAWRRLSLEAERSCDDAVLGASESTAYADQLVALARRMMASKSPVLAMASRSDLATRVRSVLDIRARRGRAGKLLCAAACAVAIALALIVAPLKLVSAPRLSSPESVAALSAQPVATGPAADPAAPPQQITAVSAAAPDSAKPPMIVMVLDEQRKEILVSTGRGLLETLADARFVGTQRPEDVRLTLVRSGQRMNLNYPDLLRHPESAPELRANEAVLVYVDQSAPQALAAANVASAPAPQSAGQAFAPVGRAQFRAETQIVLVNVGAHDAFGLTITGLSASDFTVTENGVPQALGSFRFVDVADKSSAYYELGYYAIPDPDGSQGSRRIDVTCKNPAAKLTHRDGYWERGEPAATAQDLGPGITAPSLLRRVLPEYSEDALKAKFQGTVVLQVEVDVSGQVTSVQVRRSLGLGLDEKAVAAVKQWRFSPGKNNGTPVATSVDVQVSFRML